MYDIIIVTEPHEQIARIECKKQSEYQKTIQQHIDGQKNQKICIPLSLMKTLKREMPQQPFHLYFLLTSYSFFPSFVQTVKAFTDGKAICRYYRKLPYHHHMEEHNILLDDLYVLTKIFGFPNDLFLKRSKKTVDSVRHTIVTVQFENKVIAHLEYTFVDETDQIYLEYRCKDHQLLYDSEKMNAFQEDGQGMKIEMDEKTTVRYATLVDHRVTKVLDHLDALLKTEAS